MVLVEAGAVVLASVGVVVRVTGVALVRADVRSLRVMALRRCRACMVGCIAPYGDYPPWCGGGKAVHELTRDFSKIAHFRCLRVFQKL